MENVKFLLFLLLLLSNSARALTCSRTTTKFLFINGIRNEQEDYLKSVKTLNKIVNKMGNQLDANGVEEVEGVQNISRGAYNDIQELKAQVATNYFGAKRGEYWKALAKKQIAQKFIEAPGSFNKELIEKKTNEAFDQIYGRKYKKDLITKVEDQSYFRETDHFNLIIRYDLQLAIILENAVADEEVVQYLRSRILSAYDGGKSKVIIIAHSQGNEVLKLAIDSIISEHIPTTLKNAEKIWFTSVVGALQVALPSPSTIPVKSAKYLLLDGDLVIGNAVYATGVSAVYANLFADETKSLEGTFSYYWNRAKALASLPVDPDKFFRHGLDETYLSDKINVRNKNDESMSMLANFKKNLIQVAENLSSNCRPTVSNGSAYCESDYDSVSRKMISKGRLYSVSFNSTETDLPVSFQDESTCTRQAHNYSGSIYCSPLNGALESYLASMKIIGGEVININFPHPCPVGTPLTDSSTIRF